MSEKKKIPRIVTFDILRGFFLIAIINDHVDFFPNFLDWWGMRGLLLVSTAEGFFLISGMVLGVVRGAKLVDTAFKDVAKIVLKRAFILYATHFVLVVGFTLMGWYLFPGNDNIKYGIMADHNLLRLIWDTLSLQYIYGWADYLRFYAVFIAISPLALWLLRKGLWYVVIAASVLFWLLFPLDYHTTQWQTLELLQPIAWQIIFFVGLVIGFHWPDIAGWCAKHKRQLMRYVGWPVIVLAILTMAWNVFAVFANEFIHSPWTQMLSNKAWELRLNDFRKETMPGLRLGLFFLWFWAAFLLVQRYEKRILKYAGWLLVPFGTNSLYVYTLHAIILYVMHVYVTAGVPVVNFIVTVAVVAMIYLAIRTKFLMTIIPR